MEENIKLFIQDMGIDSPEDIKNLYFDYLQETSVIIEQLASNFSTLTCSEAEKLVHNLKGVSANLYVQGVYQAALQLDDYLKGHLGESIMDANSCLLLKNLVNTYEKESKEINSYFESNLNSKIG